MTRHENVALGDLRPGDRCYLRGCPEVPTVRAVQHIGALVIVDFADGTSTAPLPAGLTIEAVHRDDIIDPPNQSWTSADGCCRFHYDSRDDEPHEHRFTEPVEIGTPPMHFYRCECGSLER